jgi:hypothetical protein
LERFSILAKLAHKILDVLGTPEEKAGVKRLFYTLAVNQFVIALHGDRSPAALPVEILFLQKLERSLFKVPVSRCTEAREIPYGWGNNAEHYNNPSNCGDSK